MVYENVEKLCFERKITISGLEKEIGFGNGTISKWKESSPLLSKAKLVADYFGITVDELLKEN